MKPSLLRLAAWLADALPLRFRKGLYRLGPVSRVLRSALNRAAPEGMTEVTVAAGPMKGIRLMLDLQTEKDLWLGNYEPELLAMLQAVTPAGGVAFDVGANIGLISLTLAESVGPEGQVVAFEALPANVERLRANLELNECGRRVRVEAAAAGAATGESVFLVHRSGGMGKLGGSAGRDETYDDEIAVSVVSLDDYVFQQEHPLPSLIKIDVEGGEGMVLQGAGRLLAEQLPTLLIELHGPEAALSVWEQLMRFGYAVRELKPRLPQVTAPKQLGWKAYIVALPPRQPRERA
jgi:FkbM family methyltransferase